MAHTKSKVAAKRVDLKKRVLEIAKGLLDDYEKDIESGIEEGIYDKKENVGTRKFIKESRKVFEEFEKTNTEILIFVEGGNVQGVSANGHASVMVYDKDNYLGCDDKEARTFEKTYGHPDTWDDMLSKRIKRGDLVPVY